MALLLRSLESLSVVTPAVLLFVWVVILLFRLKKSRCAAPFFAWASLGSVFLMLGVPFASAPLGLHLGRGDPFPAHLIMFPTVAVLVLVSLVAALAAAVGFIRSRFQGRRGGALSRQNRQPK
ncbi:MAG TPA: hypothetical protein VM285_03780 [Polyangia bacterium]|nr:hypothetical protein [Polyangia bacterium]